MVTESLDIQQKEEWARKLAEIEKKKEALVLSGVEVPRDVVSNILKFLPQTTIVHNVSLVCKSFLVESRQPHLHTTLNLQRWEMTMRSLLELVGRPQFSRLTTLKMPRLFLGEKGLTELARLCPFLSDIDAYSARFNTKMIVLAEKFPLLSGLRLKTVEIQEVVDFAKRSGPSLRKLSFDCSISYAMSRKDFVDIVDACPNLQVFECTGIVCGTGPEYDIIYMLQKCKDLRELKVCAGSPLYESLAEQITKTPHSLKRFAALYNFGYTWGDSNPWGMWGYVGFGGESARENLTGMVPALDLLEKQIMANERAIS